MPLYEVVLQFDDREETRLTDRDAYALGGRVAIGSRRFRVASVGPGRRPGVDARFVLEVEAPGVEARGVSGG